MLTAPPLFQNPLACAYQERQVKDIAYTLAVWYNSKATKVDGDTFKLVRTTCTNSVCTLVLQWKAKNGKLEAQVEAANKFGKVISKKSNALDLKAVCSRMSTTQRTAV